MTIVQPHLSFTASRRGVLRKAALIAGGAVAAASGAFPASAAAKKMAQSAASYQTTPKGAARCSACALFQAPASCQSVAGVISPQGWCILFAAK